MRPDQWERLERALALVAELAPEMREQRLRELLVSDPEALEIALETIRPSSEGSRFLRPPSLRTVVGPGEEADLVGVRIGDVLIGERIGAGGMGVVYRGLQPALDRRVAIKVLFWSSARNRDRKRFENEARAAARLDHPSIVRVHSIGQEKGIDYLVMELVDGPDLAVEIARMVQPKPPRGRLPAHGTRRYHRAVAELVAQASDALSYAHEHGVHHRDVKPANLLLDPAGRIRVVDFGLARDLSTPSITGTGDLAGTPAYMSPEQVRDPRSADARTDVYSLGVVLYELLTLTRPFRGSIPAILTQVAERSPAHVSTLNRRVPRELAVICHTAMAHRAEDRYPTAAALRDDVRRYLDGEPIRAREPGLDDRAARWFRQRRALLSTVTVGGCGTWLAAQWAVNRAARSRLPEVRIEFAGPVRAGEEWQVAIRDLDPITCRPSPRRVVGTVPYRDRIEPGYFRFEVRNASDTLFEFTRLVRPEDELLAIDFDPSRPSDARDMVRIDGAVLRYPKDGVTLSVLDGREIAVEPFFLDRYEVSVARYRAFLDATSTPAPSRWKDLDVYGRERRPVVGVTWSEARAFAEWAGKRLPTFPEMALAGRGVEGRSFPSATGEWNGAVNGPIPVPATPSEVIAGYVAHTVDVDSMPETRSPRGVHHLFGNVWEWTDNLGANLEGEQLVPLFETRLCFGGDWTARARNHTLRASSKNGVGRSDVQWNTGFRCARSAAD